MCGRVLVDTGGALVLDECVLGGPCQDLRRVGTDHGIVLSY